MIKLILIRHSITFGNTLRRYIGRTDEPLCEEGRRLLRERNYPSAERVFTSHLLRCQESARLIYPGQEIYVIDKLAECDFGEFENKNADELQGSAAYQEWVDSFASLPFPGGESREGFVIRSLEGLQEVLGICRREKIKTAALVVHGGTIMSIMGGYGYPTLDYYTWGCANGDGYLLTIDEELEYEVDIVSRAAGICYRSDTGRSQMAVSSGESNRSVDFNHRKNYKKLFSKE